MVEFGVVPRIVQHAHRRVGEHDVRGEARGDQSGQPAAAAEFEHRGAAQGCRMLHNIVCEEKRSAPHLHSHTSKWRLALMPHQHLRTPAWALAPPHNQIPIGVKRLRTNRCWPRRCRWPHLSLHAVICIGGEGEGGGCVMGSRLV
eukprot:scaffold21439_cov129-Isochrysis_galbana.AAC.8